MKRSVLALVVVAVVVGCGTLNGPRTGAVSPPTDALARWQTFPADQNPRPIVLLSTDSPGQGFDTNDAKIAALCNKFALQTRLPAEIPTPAGLSAADAYAAITKPGPGASNAQCARFAPLQVTAHASVQRVSRRPRRGADAGLVLQKPPARGQNSSGRRSAPSALWPGPFERSIGGGATVSPSGRQLTFSFVGGPPDGPRAEDYTGVVAESPHAVAVAVQSNPGRVQGGPVALTGRAQRSVTVQLASPLGGRVLVDASGAAVEACPEAIRAGCF